MLRRLIELLALVIATIAVSACSAGKPQAAAAAPGEPRVIKMDATIHLPVILVENSPSELAPETKPESLAIIAGGADELPQGPTGFAVMDDGEYLVSDPVRKRVVVYDARGAYRAQWRVGFAVDSIGAGADGTFLLSVAESGERRIYDSAGNQRAGSPASEPLMSARLAGPNAGIIDGRRAGGPLNVRFNSDAMHLISLQPLGAGPDGSVYVALEVTAGGDTIDIGKQVRKYSANGDLAAEVREIPLDYYVTPTDELKVRKGILYQMAPAKSEIRINRWDMN